MKPILRTLCVAVALVLAACGGKTEGGDEAGEPGRPSASPGGGSSTPDAGADVEPICLEGSPDGTEYQVPCDPWVIEAWKRQQAGGAQRVNRVDVEGVERTSQALIASALCTDHDASGSKNGSAPACCYDVRDCQVSTGTTIRRFNCATSLGAKVCIRSGTTQARAVLSRITTNVANMWAADCACATLNSAANIQAGSVNECSLSFSWRRTGISTPDHHAIIGNPLFPGASGVCIRPSRGHRVWFNVHQAFYAGQGTCRGVTYTEHSKAECDAAGVPL